MPTDDLYSLAEGRKLLGAILAGKLVMDHQNNEKYSGRDGRSVRHHTIHWQSFATPVQQDIAAVITAGAELHGLHVLHHGAIVCMCSRLPGGNSEATRAELNAIDPFRWRRGDGKLGREVKS